MIKLELNDNEYWQLHNALIAAADLYSSHAAEMDKANQPYIAEDFRGSRKRTLEIKDKLQDQYDSQED